MAKAKKKTKARGGGTIFGPVSALLEQGKESCTPWKGPKEKKEQLGFLQLCIERRFHRAVQETFEQVTGLDAHDYWQHSDFGGTPKMQHEEDRARYAYDNGARVMGWSAHGAVCGAFKPPLHPTKASDDEIRAALATVFVTKPFLYPKATHYVFFATEDAHGKPVVWHRGPIRAV